MEPPKDTSPNNKKEAKTIVGEKLLNKIALGFCGPIDKDKDIGPQILEHGKLQAEIFAAQVKGAADTLKSTNEFKTSTNADELISKLFTDQELLKQTSFNWAAGLIGEASNISVSILANNEWGIRRRAYHPDGKQGVINGEEKIKKLDQIDPNIRKEALVNLLAISTILAQSESVGSISSDEIKFINSCLDNKPDPKYSAAVSEADKLGEGLLKIAIAQKMVNDLGKEIVLKATDIPQDKPLSVDQQRLLSTHTQDFIAPPEFRQDIKNLNYNEMASFGKPPTLVEIFYERLKQSYKKKF